MIEKVYRKDEIYEGPCLEQAPDLVLLPSEGFNFKARLRAGGLFEKSIFTGKHTQKDAFLLVNSPSEDVVPKKPSVSDVVSIMNRLKDRNGNGQ